MCGQALCHEPRGAIQNIVCSESAGLTLFFKGGKMTDETHSCGIIKNCQVAYVMLAKCPAIDLIAFSRASCDQSLVFFYIFGI